LNSCGADAPRAFQDCFSPVGTITEQQLKEFLSLREIQGLCDEWINGINRYLTRFLDYVDWSADREKTIKYLTQERQHYSTSTYRKNIYQIRKFLLFCGYSWVNEIQLPREPEIVIKHISTDDILKTLHLIDSKNNPERYTALILLGATSGLRSQEMYQLTPDDIDLTNRTVYVHHAPSEGKTTKTKHSRVSFFTPVAQEKISIYLRIYRDDSRQCPLFPKDQCIQALKYTPIRVKDLRKYFSQEWDRRSGPTGAKKLLMGHSLRGDVDLCHYNTQSEQDLRVIYDKVIGGEILWQTKERKSGTSLGSLKTPIKKLS
jgi:integrase/recombinase XerD